MTFRYRLTRSAKRDLREIAAYWTAQASPDVALRIFTSIIETIISLSLMPEAGPLAEMFGSNVRRVPAGKYMVYYRASRSAIQVLHVFHGARDQHKAWQE